MLPVQHAGCHQGRGGQLLAPGRQGLRPRDLGCDLTQVVEFGEVEADRSVAHGSAGECDGQEHLGFGFVAQAPQAQGDVHIGGGDQPRSVGVTEDAVGAQRVAVVEWGVGLEELGHAAPPSPSSRSLTAVTSAVGGRQEKTPVGWPSTSGVASPHMPRT